MPKVSVVLTSYNHADYVSKSIESILNQTYKDFELIIVDDCSTDNSWNIIKSYKDKRIKAIRHKRNKGGVITPELIEKLKGKYFAIAHCDDMWEKDKLEKQVKFMESHSKYAACFTWVKIIDEQDKELNSNSYVNFNVKNKSRNEWLNHFFYHGNCLCHPSVLIRTKVQIQESLYARGLGALPDMYRWVKLCLKHDIYIYPEKLTCFRVRKGGMNTSGYNFHNIVRYSYDVFKILNLYKKIPSNDLMKVFPESTKYKKNDYFNSNFALARICIDEVGSNNYTLFGLNCIYDLLQDTKEEDLLQKNYKYTFKDFVKETGEKDIFSIINRNQINLSSLYYSLGEGYNENNKFSKKVVTKSDNSFDVIYDNLNLKVDGLRFDPDEGTFKMYSEIKIYVNNKEVDFKANALVNEKNEYFFYTSDPWFEIKYQGLVKSVYISGKYYNIDFNDVLDYNTEAVTIEVTKKVKSEINSRRIINRIKRKIFRK